MTINTNGGCSGESLRVKKTLSNGFVKTRTNGNSETSNAI